MCRLVQIFEGRLHSKMIFEGRLHGKLKCIRERSEIITLQELNIRCYSWIQNSYWDREELATWNPMLPTMLVLRERGPGESQIVFWTQKRQLFIPPVNYIDFCFPFPCSVKDQLFFDVKSKHCVLFAWEETMQQNRNFHSFKNEWKHFKQSSHWFETRSLRAEYIFSVCAVGNLFTGRALQNQPCVCECSVCVVVCQWACVRVCLMLFVRTHVWRGSF